MNLKSAYLSIFALVGLIMFESGLAAEPTGFWVWGSVADNTKRENMDAYEVSIIFGLPWEKKTASGWNITTRLEITGGVLDGADQTGLFGAVTPGVAWRHRKVALDVGAGILLLDETRFGRQDFSGSFQFSAHAGIAYDITKNLALGLRYRHISDADIHDTNADGTGSDDANFLLVGISFRL